MSVLQFIPSGHVAVFVEGIVESALLAAIARGVRRAFRHFVGQWRVTVRPIDRGRWRLELSGGSGRHLWLFAAPMNGLPEIVVEKLEEFLRSSAAAFRPAIV